MRPQRSSIFDNLSEMDRVLWDTFCEDADRARQTPKLTARRSRRRPGDWAARANAPMVRGVSYEILARIDSSNDDTVAWFEGEYGFPRGTWRHDWTSPAQRGRKTGRMRSRKPRGVNTIQFIGSGGTSIQVIASSACPEGTAYVFAENAVHSLHVGRGIRLEELETATRGLGRIERINVPPRVMAGLNREVAGLRRYDASFQR